MDELRQEKNRSLKVELNHERKQILGENCDEKIYFTI
jgi:hypothetical protein